MSSSRTKNLSKANKISSILIAMADNFNLGIIFIMKQFFQAILEESAKYALFPLAAVATILQALLGWNLVHINSGKDSSQILRAVIGSLTAISITAAVVISLAFGKTPVYGYELGQFVPYIFAATIGINTLIHLATSAYYGVKALQAKPVLNAEDSLEGKTEYPAERSHNIQAAVNNLLSAGIGAEIAATIIAVMIYEQTEVSATLGCTTMLTGNTYLLYALYQVLRSDRKQPETALINDFEEIKPAPKKHDEDAGCLSRLGLFKPKAPKGYLPIADEEQASPAFSTLSA